MQISCTRRIQFAYGHRVMGHENKCRHLHGHNGVVLLKAVRCDCPVLSGAVAPVPAQQTDDVGRVVDFSVLKDRVGGWIDANWDHAFLYHRADAAVIIALERFEVHEGPLFQQKKAELPFNPTAENMASYLLDIVCPVVLAGTGVRVVEVTMWETENCFATAKESA